MKILLLTHRLPFAPNRGDRVRAYHLIKLLAARADVHVVSLVHDREEEAQADKVRALGARVSTARVPRALNMMRAAAMWPTSTPLTHLLLDSPGMRTAIEAAVREAPPDVVVAYCSGVAPFALRAPLAGIPLVLDFVDVDSAKWAAFAEPARAPRKWIYRREARCLAAFEARAAQGARASTVVNEREAEALRRLAPSARVHVVANGVDLEHLAPPGGPAVEPRVIFTGVFNYAPNSDGALWFAREVWPRVRAAVPAAHLTLAGSSPVQAVRQLAAHDASIEVTGAVPDMRPFLWRSAIAVAPIFQARGLQNKVLEAAAAGLPSVITSAVWNGLPDEVLPACRKADDAAAFAREVIDLLSRPADARRRCADAARLAELGWPQRLQPLLDLIGAAAENSPATARARLGRILYGRGAQTL